MNREVKFRGFDKKRNEWVYGYFFTFGDRAFILEPGKEGIPEQYIEIMVESVGQFTGLRDKNSEEVYEGDIWEEPFEGGNERGLIRWNKEGACFEIVECDESALDSMKDLIFLHNGKVIGNIYENPELLIN